MCNNLLYQTLYLVDELNDVSNLLSNLQGIEDVEKNNRNGHHTAVPWLLSAYMHTKCTVGHMMANPNDLYSVDELVDVCSR